MEGRQARTGGVAGMGTLICCRLVWGSQELDTPLLRQLTVGQTREAIAFLTEVSFRRFLRNAP